MNPNSISDLRHIRAQGANVGDYRDFDGITWRWNGEVWEMEGGGGGGGGGGGMPNYPAFDFDWDAARLAAFDPNNPGASVLGRYYLQLLEEAEYDTELAKKYLEADYNRGLRITEEDHESTVIEDIIKAGEETRDLRGTLNARGVLLGQIQEGGKPSAAPASEFAKRWHLDPLEKRQDLRRQAIERAAQRTKEELSLAKTRGIHEENIQFPRTERRLQEETREKAYYEHVPAKYQEEYTKHKAAHNIP